MHQQHQVERRGTLALIALGIVVLAFMGLSLAVTTAGTARFALALGYPPEVGYAVGTILDLGKAVLPVGLLMLVARRAYLFVAVLGIAWLGLATFTWLATSATVGSAITSIERNGTWRMEGRANAQTELASVEQRLAALSQPTPPRPVATVAEALASERVPAGVWRDSQECESIRSSRYFAQACSTVLELRRELAAAQDYETLDARARELRDALATMPVVATRDPLPRAFAATLGRLIPLDGEAGVAHLLTLVIELVSCFGLAALRVLRDERGRDAGSRNAAPRLLPIGLHGPSGTIGYEPGAVAHNLPDEAARILPRSSLKSAQAESRTAPTGMSREESEAPSNVVPMMRAQRSGTSQRRARRRGSRSSAPGRREVGIHVQEFARARLLPATGTSLSASELRAAYEAWCAAHGHEPLSQQKLGSELTAIGLIRSKSRGLIRYRDVQIAA
jgi:hypothetical protein